MENPILSYKNRRKLTYEQIADMCGLKSKALVNMHCKGVRRISPESALKYHKGLGIPLSAMRPDIWAPRRKKAQPCLENAN